MKVFVAVFFNIFIGTALCQNILWMRQYDSGMEDFAYSTAVDANGDIIVAGGTGDTIFNHLVVKYDSNGDVLWTKEYDFGGNDFASDVAIDRSGNIITVGYTIDSTYVENFLIVKYFPNGDTAWSWHSQLNSAQAMGVAVDTSNNIYVSGIIFDYTANLLLVKCGPDGDTIWTRIYDSGVDELGTRVVIDNNNDVIVSGAVCQSGPFYDCLLIKYHSNGDTVWSRRYDYLQDELLSDLVVDSLDNIISAGVTGDGMIDYDHLTIKCNANGDTIWSRRYDGDSYDVPCVTVNSSNDIFVNCNSVHGANAFFTIRYNPDGVFRWLGSYDSGNDDQSGGIAVDTANNIIVSGYSLHGFNYDCVTIKYRADVAIEENSQNRSQKAKTLKLAIYPQPAKHIVNIRTSSSSVIEAIRIYDVCGKLIREQRSKGLAGESRISVSDMSAGVYFIKVKVDGQELSENLVITK